MTRLLAEHTHGISRMGKWKAGALVLAAMLAAAGPGIAQADTLEGRWLTGKRKVAITFFACGDAVCGRMDWLAKPRYRGGELKIDRENPDPALRARPWCGIDVISGLRPKGTGKWVDGEVYNPKDGKAYDFEVRRDGDGLKVNAFLGIKLLGKSEDWIRAPADLPGCTES